MSLNMSYSQIGQDLEVLKIYNNKTNGFFIDIGANDGIKLSNTYLLEKDYQWKGICVEPNPRIFNLLYTNRPNAICCSKAVYNRSDIAVLFDIFTMNDVFSGIHTDLERNIIDANKNKYQILVKAITINDLLDMYKAPLFIDYLSLDTEGSEYEILKSVDFGKYTFGIIDVEHNYIEPKRTHIRELLMSKNYEYIGANKWDDRYMHKSL